jgi:hypothetical protein
MIINICTLTFKTYKANTTAHKGTDRFRYNNSGCLQNPTLQYTTLNCDHPDQKKRKNQQKTSELNCSTEQIDLIGLYRIFHLTDVEYTFFSEAHRTFSKIAHSVGHKASLNKHRNIKLLCLIRS